MSYSLLVTLCCLLAADIALCESYDPTRFGAIPNDGYSDTEPIQRAIDECSKSGGGDVELKRGTFVAGSLRLKTGVTLRIGAEATLECANDRDEFHGGVWIQASDAKKVAIVGPGKIDGKGSDCFRLRFDSVFNWLKDGARSGAVKHPVEVEGRLYVHMIQFSNCVDVTLKDIRLEDSQHWTVHVLACRHVEISRVTVRNVPYGPYTDGIDIDSSSNVRVVDCDVTAGDDAYCVKTTGKRDVRAPATNILFERCVARSPTNGFKIGTETRFDISDVTFQGCKVEPAIPGIGPIGGLTITSVDGAKVSRIRAEDMTIQLARCPVFIRLGNRGRGQSKKPSSPGAISGVKIQHVSVQACTMPIVVSGIEDAPVTDVLLHDISINRFGTGAQHNPESVPEKVDAYPEATMFGQVPGRILFCRHAADVRLRRLSASAGRSTDGKDVVVANCKNFEGEITTQ